MHKGISPEVGWGTRGVRRWSGGLAVVVLAGCAAFIANTDVSLVSLRLSSSTVDGGSVETSFRVQNHNTGTSRLVGVLYHFLIETPDGWIQVAEGYSVQDLELPSRRPVDFAYSFPVDTDDGPSVALGPAVSRGEYRLEGELRVLGGLGEVQVPFHFTGNDGGDPGEPQAVR